MKNSLGKLLYWHFQGVNGECITSLVRNRLCVMEASFADELIVSLFSPLFRSLEDMQEKRRSLHV